ncbi:MAG: signal peptidase I [Gammaproteobacteria bacterium]
MDFDFSFFLVIATLVTGIIWGGYVIFLEFLPNVKAPEQEPLVVEYAKSFFPIFLIVLLIRSFLAEPFRIPSGSMMPTLLIGDFILVNKFTYGIRLPVLNKKIIELNEPERGDIVVFRFPKDPSVDYIKRVVGVPGDRVRYQGKKIYINGNPAEQVSIGRYDGAGKGEKESGDEHLIENLNRVEHSILINHRAVTVNDVFTVPKGQYFVMGDNRDNSNDSRYWGFVPEQNLVGKAFFIWMNLDWKNKSIGLDRIGTVLK